MSRAFLSAAALALATTVSGAAWAQDGKQTIMPEDPDALAFQQAVGYSQAVVAGDLVILSGVVAGPADGDEGMEPGFARAFDAITRTLERAGVGWDDVVEIQTFHTDLPAQIETFAEVKNRYVNAPFPAWTAIGITALYEPDALVEIKVTAYKGED